VVLRKLKFTDIQHPIVAQIWGNNPENFYRATKIVNKLGFDGVDVNMGCPIRDVIKKKAGSGLIGEYKLSQEIIKAVKKGAGDMPVSVKTRLGINKNIAEEWSTFLLQQNIAALTIHGRTAAQMSKVPADWNEIKKIVDLRNKISPQTLIIGNGDVKSYREIIIKHNEYGVDGIMVGRGVFDNPWIFEAAQKEHTKVEYLDLLKLHLDYFEKEVTNIKDQKKRYPSLKKFFKIYIKDFKGANMTRQKFMETSTLKEGRDLLNKLSRVKT
jgi:tRNA-dihydrouridine synthase